MHRLGFVVLAWMLAASPALAAPKAADAAFERGRVALAAGNYEEACSEFEKSLELDFQYGTLFNLADCNDKRGKLVASLAMWNRIAKEDKKAARAQRAREIAATLERRIPRIRVTLNPPVADARVTIDGMLISALDTPIPVDPGSHEILVIVPPDREVRRTINALQEGALVPVVVETAPAVEPPAPTLPETPETDTDTPPRPISSGRATAGKAIVVVGAASLAGGLVFGGLALARWSDAEDTAKTDIPAANDVVDKVRLYGNLSTGLLAGGAAAVALGIYLWRSGTHSVQPVAAVSGNGASLGIVGDF